MQVTTEPTFAPGVSTPLFELPTGFGALNTVTMYDVSADDRRFLMARLLGASGSETSGRELIVVENFYEELKAKLAKWKEAPGGTFCHPREEHLLPLFTVVGAGAALGP